MLPLPGERESPGVVPMDEVGGAVGADRSAPGVDRVDRPGSLARRVKQAVPLVESPGGFEVVRWDDRALLGQEAVLRSPGDGQPPAQAVAAHRRSQSPQPLLPLLVPPGVNGHLELPGGIRVFRVVDHLQIDGSQRAPAPSGPDCCPGCRRTPPDPVRAASNGCRRRSRRRRGAISTGRCPRGGSTSCPSPRP